MKHARLFTRDFTIMVTGQIISLFGNAILRFALSLYVLDLTGSAAAFGGILALSMVPTVLLSPFGGMLADRVPRQRIMWGLDFFTAALVGGYALITGTAGLPTVAVVMMLLSAIQAMYQPSVQSSVPLLAGEANLMAANGVVVQVQALASLLGPILGGVLYGTLVPKHGMAPVLLASAACFLLSAVMELFLRIPFVRRPRSGSALAQVRTDLGGAFRFLVRDNPATAQLLAIVAGLNLFLSALFLVGLPYVIKVHLGLSAQLYSYSEAAMGLGSILGGLLSASLARRAGLRGSHRFLVACSGLLLPMAAVLALGAPPMAAYGVITACVLLGMAAASLFTIACQTFLQRITPVELLGKVASFVTMVSVCAMPLGQAMYGVLFALLPPWLVVLAGALVSVGLSLAARRALRAAEAQMAGA